MHRRDMLRAGLRRLALLLVGLTAGTGLGGLALGALIGAPIDRAVSVAFYGVGSFGLVAGFFVGNRGPARGRGSGIDGGLLGGRRNLRWATRDEQEEAISLSALLVVAGVVLVLIGLAIDPRVQVA